MSSPNWIRASLKKVTGLSVEDFNMLCSLGVFNAPLMNDAIFKFKRYEDASLTYTGIDKHADDEVGGWDTTIRKAQYEKLFYNQQSSMTEYHKLDDTFDESIFTENTIRGKLGDNAIESVKSLYDLVVVDSVGTEKPFAEQLEKQEDVVVYTKLPRGFYINTPMGHYNPDWAIAFKEGTVKHVYFVAETKGATKYEMKSADLRGVEESKIDCARKHFESISGGTLKFDIVSSFAELSELLMN